MSKAIENSSQDTRTRATRGELAVCALGLCLVALVMCSAHVRNGGFYYDDWSVVALGRFPPPGGLLHGLWLNYGQRPGQVLYYAALDEALGVHAAPRLALAAAMAVLQATSLYALLRRLRFRARDAGAIAVLSLTFPFSDSVWLWGILSLTSLAIAAALGGVILALRAFDSSGRRALLLHAGSLALYVASVASYEAFAVAGCVAGLLYVRAVGFARARLRWALDVVAIGATLAFVRTVLPIDVATPSRAQSFAGMAAHLGSIAARGARLAGAAVLPLAGSWQWIGTAVLVAVLLAAAGLRSCLPVGDAARAELGRWLGIAGAGVVVALAAWAVYVPAPDHYSPTALGTVNRMNAGAGIGIAILVYACIVLLVIVLVRRLRLAGSAAVLGSTAVALALGAGYVSQTAQDARAWDGAARDQRRLLADLRVALPRLPRSAAVLYVFDAPLLVGPGIPVLNTTLDLTSAVRISYGNRELAGVPIGAAAGVVCSPAGPLGGGVGGAYGESYLVDAAARRAVPLPSHATCAFRAADRIGG